MARDFSLLLVDEEKLHTFARSCAMAKALHDHTTAVKTTSGNVIGDMFAYVFGHSLQDVEQNWKLIKADANTWSESLADSLIEKAGEGPEIFKDFAKRMDESRSERWRRVEAVFTQVHGANSAYVAHMKNCHHAAVVVKYTALAAVATMSGVGGMTGALTFLQSLAFGVSSKMAYNTAKGWAEGGEMDAVLINTRDSAAKDTRDSGLIQPGIEGLFKTAAQICTGFLLPNDKVAKIASERIARQQELWRRALKRGSEESMKKAEGRIARATAEKLAAQNADKGLRLTGNLASGVSKALPVLWMGKDFYDMGIELKGDLKNW
jgi:hypothetical protein